MTAALAGGAEAEARRGRRHGGQGQGGASVAREEESREKGREGGTRGESKLI